MSLAFHSMIAAELVAEREAAAAFHEERFAAAGAAADVSDAPVLKFLFPRMIELPTTTKLLTLNLLFFRQACTR
jgi:hypothetical protein